MLNEAPSTLRSFIVPILMDVTRQDEIERARAEVGRHLTQKRLGLHALINNAGVSSPGSPCCLDVFPLLHLVSSHPLIPSGPLEFLSDEAVRQVYETNVIGLLATTRTFLPLLQDSISMFV